MREKQKIISLYNDKKTYAVKQVVSIGDEEDLNQFWEYIILNNTSFPSDMYTFYVSLYELAARFLEDFSGTFFEIIIEQSDEAYYFTVWNRIFTDFGRQIWDKRAIAYRTDGKRISVRLKKKILAEQEIHQVQKENARIDLLLASVDNRTHHRQEPYTFIEKEDLGELLALAEDVGEYLFQAQENGFTADSCSRIRSYFSMISITLNHYQEIKAVATIMSEFSMMIFQYKEKVTALNSRQITLIEGFTHNFGRWLRVLFVEGGANLHFMDRSLRADIEMIRSLLEPRESEETVNLNGVFDF
ncbi:MAG: hypothetical protein PHW64_07570 [Sulfuricurvum sp.]|nr:hypothetical protein [Sulfuricurvum sp.]